LTTLDNLVKILLPAAGINVTTIIAARPILMIGPELLIPANYQIQYNVEQFDISVTNL
jgi:hypothetical protein